MVGSGLYRENYIDSLRTEMVKIVADHLSPLALKYGYSDVPLESNIKWRPLVLILGNYSSGKSTLINELLNCEVQTTGQAPTDDSFTVIALDENDDGTDSQIVRVTEERDGKVLLNDPEFPFELLKKHGERFSSHFRLKKVNSPFLKHMALIDTPGMLDSVSERDRGYDYQEVIGDLALIADLVLVLFDPHKAGTVREAHASLRDTLPAKTFEDRVLFVLNRIDECASLNDLLRVYGTLCWNLSQMTGRKDIPQIRLTYSPHATGPAAEGARRYLSLLENQREELKQSILQAPRHRLDHLASYVETHGERLAHFLEALLGYGKRKRTFSLKWSFAAFVGCIALGGGAFFFATDTELFANLDQQWLIIGSAVLSIVAFGLYLLIVARYFHGFFHRRVLKSIDDLTKLDNQTRQDSWRAVRDMVFIYLKTSGGKFPRKTVQQEYQLVQRVCEKGTREIREALKELGTIRH